MRILRHLWIVVLVGGLNSSQGNWAFGKDRPGSAGDAVGNALDGAAENEAKGQEETRKAKEERDKEKDAQARQDQGAAQEHRKKAEEHEEKARKHFEQAKALRDNAAQNQQAGDAASTQDAGKGSSQASGKGGEKGGGEGGAPPQMPSPQQSQQGNDSQGNDQAQNQSQPQPRQPEPQRPEQTAQNQPQQDTVTQKQMEEMRTELDNIKAKEASLMERASQAAKPFQDIAQAATENYIRTLPGGDAAMDSFNKTYETLTPSKAGGLSSLKNRVANRIAERSWNNSSAPKYLGEWRNSVFQRSVASGSKAWQTWRTSWYGK